MLGDQINMSLSPVVVHVPLSSAFRILYRPYGHCLNEKLDDDYYHLKVGDVILEERPVAWGPKQLSPVCCVACCAPLGYFEISWCDRYTGYRVFFILVGVSSFMVYLII